MHGWSRFTCFMNFPIILSDSPFEQLFRRVDGRDASIPGVPQHFQGLFNGHRKSRFRDALQLLDSLALHQ